MSYQTNFQRLGRKCIRIAIRVINPGISIIDRHLTHRFSVHDINHQPVFIVGAPRTGSTILYQAITNYFNVFYIDNITCYFYKNLVFGAWLSNKIYRNRPHNNFLAEYGDTRQYGGHAPSECGEFWYLWVKKGVDFVDFNQIKDSDVNNIKKVFCAISDYYENPIVIKNLNMGQRLRLINKCFPEAKIIFIKRKIEENINSIKEARKLFGVDADNWWSVKPRDYYKFRALPEGELIMKQIQSINAQIEGDLDLFPDENVLKIDYSDLGEDVIKKIGVWLGLEMRQGGCLPRFKTDE